MVQIGRRLGALGAGALLLAACSSSGSDGAERATTTTRSSTTTSSAPAATTPSTTRPVRQGCTIDLAALDWSAPTPAIAAAARKAELQCFSVFQDHPPVINILFAATLLSGTQPKAGPATAVTDEETVAELRRTHYDAMHRADITFDGAACEDAESGGSVTMVVTLRPDIDASPFTEQSIRTGIDGLDGASATATFVRLPDDGTLAILTSTGDDFGGCAIALGVRGRRAVAAIAPTGGEVTSLARAALD